MTPEQFYSFADLLPEGFSWGDSLQPHHLEAILQNVFGKPVAFAHSSFDPNNTEVAILRHEKDSQFTQPVYFKPF